MGSLSLALIAAQVTIRPGREGVWPLLMLALFCAGVAAIIWAMVAPPPPPKKPGRKGG